MRLLRKIITGLVIFIAIFLLFALWYKYTYAMEAVTPYAIHDPGLDTKLLIASQGSAFKNAVVEGVTEHFKNDSIYIKVIDAMTLDGIPAEDWNAILILHTWEYGRPPGVVASFIRNAEDRKDRMVVVTTSGDGSFKMKGIDAITGESVVENAPAYTRKIISALEPLLKKQQ